MKTTIIITTTVIIIIIIIPRAVEVYNSPITIPNFSIPNKAAHTAGIKLITPPCCCCCWR